MSDKFCQLYCVKKKRYYWEELISYPNRYNQTKWFWQDKKPSKELYQTGLNKAAKEHPDLFQGGYKIISSSYDHAIIIEQKTNYAYISGRGSTFDLSYGAFMRDFRNDFEIFMGLPPNRTYDIAADILQHMDQLNQADKVILIGHSLSGREMEELAIMFPNFEAEIFNPGRVEIPVDENHFTTISGMLSYASANAYPSFNYNNLLPVYQEHKIYPLALNKVISSL